MRAKLKKPFNGLPELGCPDPPRLARTIERQREASVKNIFAGNLDSAATDLSVYSLFERTGAVAAGSAKAQGREAEGNQGAQCGRNRS